MDTSLLLIRLQQNKAVDGAKPEALTGILPLLCCGCMYLIV